MPSKDRIKAKGRAEEVISFAGIPRNVIESRKYALLSGWSVKLLVDLAYQFRGKNNGNLEATFATLKCRGWRSSGTLAKALAELQELGFLQLTRQGGKHKPNLYGLSWKKIDECLDKQKRHKLDCPPTNTPANTWRD